MQHCWLKQNVACITWLFVGEWTGFVRVMENLESHGILEFDFPGLESHGN